MVNPLEELSDVLAADMQAVDEAIVENMQSSVALIPQLAGYLIAAGGKRIRPLLTLASTAIYGGDMARAHNLAAVVEFIHSATLLHDDVVDESVMRRGQESAPQVFGNSASVLVGDYLFSKSFQMMVADGSLEILRVLSDASAIIAQGEVMQLSTANNLETTLDDYIEVIKAKTAALFAAGCEVGPMIAGSDPAQGRAMAEYGMNLGIAFQIADDALDYKSSREAMGKAVGDDFREGKMTAPVIFALQEASAEERDFWVRVIERRDQNEGDLEKALDIFAGHGCMDKTMALAKMYTDLAKQSLGVAPDGALKPLLATAADYAVERVA